MKEMIYTFAEQYAVWGILGMTVLAVLLLWRMLARLKQLNHSLKNIGEKVHNYLEAVLTEDTEETGSMQVPEKGRREERFLTGREREILSSRRREQEDEEKEAIFQEVIQEYFS